MDIKEREKFRQQYQKYLDSIKTRIERNQFGQFATPPKLAHDIISYVLSKIPSSSYIRFLEPGFGTGPFYSALLQQVPLSRIEVAAGYEIDPLYSDIARAIWGKTGLRLYTRDFTEVDPPTTEDLKYNLIVCNPPYVRHHHLSRDQKKKLQSIIMRHLNFEVNGLSGLYVYFVILSKAWMTKGGLGAWLIPSEFMVTNYGYSLRKFLLTRVALLRVHRFDPHEVQFSDALVSSAVVFFKNTEPLPNHEVEFTFGGTLTNPKLRITVSISELSRASKWTIFYNHFSSLIENENNSLTLSDLFTIKRGLATGNNSFFILAPEQSITFGLPRECLKPILPNPRNLEVDIIEADENGEPQIRNRLYLLSCDMPREKIEIRYPTLWKYLQYGIEKGVHLRYLCRHRDPWYAQEHRPPAPFLCTYMGRKAKRKNPFRFILNYSNATAANVYLMLYPKALLASMINEKPDLYQLVWRALSSITPETLMEVGRVYGGGLYKLEPRELGKVPARIVLDVLNAC